MGVNFSVIRRPCLSCGRIIQRGSRCPPCQKARRAVLEPHRVQYGRSLYRRNRGLVLNRDGHRCQRCGAVESLEVHHIQKLKHGGSDGMENLVTVCAGCNRKLDKGAA